MRARDLGRTIGAVIKNRMRPLIALLFLSVCFAVPVMAADTSPAIQTNSSPENQAESSVKPNDGESQTNQPAESLGDKFLNEISQLRILSFGPEEGKSLYVFMDPNCPYCHQFFEMILGKIAEGKAIHLFVIPAPVLGKDSLEKTLKIYGAGDPSAAWESYMKDQTLPDSPTDKAVLESAQQTAMANMQSFQRWKLRSVPLIVWRGSNNRVMINIGTPNDVQEFFYTLGIQ